MHHIPVENLVSPDVVRRLAWTPPTPPDSDHVAAALAASGARPWQVELVAPGLAEAMAAYALRQIARPAPARRQAPKRARDIRKRAECGAH